MKHISLGAVFVLSGLGALVACDASEEDPADVGRSSGRGDDDSEGRRTDEDDGGTPAASRTVTDAGADEDPESATGEPSDGHPDSGVEARDDGPEQVGADEADQDEQEEQSNGSPEDPDPMATDEVMSGGEPMADEPKEDPQTDVDDEPSLTPDPATSETSEPGSCPAADIELGSATGSELASGTTVGAGRDVDARCTNASSEDVVVSWIAPADGCYSFDTRGSEFDTVLHLHNACPGFETLGCNDDGFVGLSSLITEQVVEGQEYLIVVDGLGRSESGPYVLNIQACTEDCTNRFDDDENGLGDCADPACANHPSCIPEVCGNGMDDDGDGRTDCDDSECTSADGCDDRAAVDVDLGSEIGDEVAVGDISGSFNDIEPSCAGQGGEDLVFRWQAPSDGCFSFTSRGSNYDTAIHVHEDSETFEELACNDDYRGSVMSRVDLEVSEGVVYFIVFDSFDLLSTGDYVLNINPCE